MNEMRTARLFMNGASQAVRLPADFRFEGEQVFVTRDERTGDVVLSTRPGSRSWDAFFELMSTIDIPQDFMADRPLNTLPEDRDLFGSEE